MSINHYSAKSSSTNHNAFFSSHLIPKSTTSTAGFWASNTTAAAAGAMFCSQTTAALSFNLNNEEDEEELPLEQAAAVDEIEANTTSIELFEQEKLFEKPLTPSDVGKLNRLVIPKQHAEKYFPMNGGDSGEKGLLLGFEDDDGKSWRFRYSYWNSSQSYVLTKGWSRFVKEKRLDAGDIVIFGRHRKDVGRLFIGWRRRNSGGGQDSGAAQPPVSGGRGGWSGVLYPGHPYPCQHQGPSSLVYQTDCSNAENQTRARSGNWKRLRLFGVNLEWPENESEPSTPEGSAASSHGQAHHHQYCSSHHHTWI